jgi:hypothetical protein
VRPALGHASPVSTPRPEQHVRSWSASQRRRRPIQSRRMDARCLLLVS